MDRLADLFSVQPAPMRDPVLFAIPYFLVLLAVEWTAARRLDRIDEQADRPASGAYLTRDARASISIGLVSVAAMGFWKLLGLLGYAWLYAYVRLSRASWNLRWRSLASGLPDGRSSGERPSTPRRRSKGPP